MYYGHCFFCGQERDFSHYCTTNSNKYVCARCGFVRLTDEAVADFPSMEYSEADKNAISVTLRNEWELSGRIPAAHNNQRTLEDLNQIISQFRPLSPLDKMDNALSICEKTTPCIGEFIRVDTSRDYPYYYCASEAELKGLYDLLQDEGFIKAPQPQSPYYKAILTSKGYQRLRELRKSNKESTQCFVAMWFTDEMKDVYNDAIAPAIEYVEPGESESRFKAIKIDNLDHLNDINDEIIAQIRRSRFMVCDLTGYRGGVYFEAGFAYGLGLDVIYTCREDWTREQILKDDQGREVKTLRDEGEQEVRIRKEGVHFDLAHMNRIEWHPDKLDEFRTALENRIKAVIV